MSKDFQLWGTFSVLDHTRPHAFVSDVLVFDKLIVPVPAGDDDKRWDTVWQGAKQAELLDAIRAADETLVDTVPWDEQQRSRFEAERTMTLASGAAFDLDNITRTARTAPDTDPQYVTRLVLQKKMGTELDAHYLRGVMQGLPDKDIKVVAAYGDLAAMRKDAHIDTAVEAGPANALDLLGGFSWPFVVPADGGFSDVDLLKRAVEFAQQPQVQDYRRAFHEWRSTVVDRGLSPDDAAADMTERIASYADWARKLKTRTTVRTACSVFVVGAGIATSIVFPLAGVPALAASLVNAGTASVGLADLISQRPFRRAPEAAAPAGPAAAGALFWEARAALGRGA